MRKRAFGIGAFLVVAALAPRAFAWADGNVAAWAPSPAAWGNGSHPVTAFGGTGPTASWSVEVQEGAGGTLTSAVDFGTPWVFTNGYGPTVANMNTGGMAMAVIEMHQAENGSAGPLWYGTGTFNGVGVSWNLAPIGTGMAPSIASRNGIVVEVHQAGAGTGPLMYRIGTYSSATGAFSWNSGGPVQYDNGSHPSIAMTSTWSNNGEELFLVEVHEGEGGQLWYHAGIVTPNGITWSPSHQYDTGYAPTVTLAGGIAVESHQAQNSPGQLWSNSGGIDGNADAVYWKGAYLYDYGFSPSIAWSDAEQKGYERHAATSGTTSLWDHAFTTVGGKPGLQLPAPPLTVAQALASYPARQQAFLAHTVCDHPPPPPGFMNPQGAQADEVDDIRSGTAFQFPGQTWSETALAMLTFQGVCNGTEYPADRLRMLNSALTKLDARGESMGTTGGDHSGDLDTALKDLIPILFNYGSVLAPDALHYLAYFIAGIDSGPYDSSLASVSIDGLMFPETENHVNLINSTRYLINQWLYPRTGNNSNYDNVNNGMRNFWLTNLQVAMQSDFAEYNARPYNKYTLDAIQNLAEFASDPAIVTAAKSVLDYQSAKFAISSSMGRRNSPFRRLTTDDGPDYFTQWDEEQCRFALYAGTAAFLPTSVGSNGQTVVNFPEGCNNVVRQAAGSYFPPPMTLELAMNKAGNHYFERYSNGPNAFHNMPGGVEIYDNEGPFLIAAGGIPLAALPIWVIAPIARDEDKGLALPTVIMPNIVYGAGDPRDATNRSALVRFEGTPGASTNTCVAPGFACGLNPVIPPALCSGKSGQYCSVNGPWTFLNFANATATDGFYVALWQAPVPGDTMGSKVGFFEAVAASEHLFNFAEFQSAVLTNNPLGSNVASASYSGGVAALGVNYKSLHSGGMITASLYTFTQASVLSSAFDYFYPVVAETSISYAPGSNMGLWPLAEVLPGQAGVNSVGHTGSDSLTVNGYGTCTWDLSNFNAPTRSSVCDARPSDYVAAPPPPKSSIGWVHNAGGQSYVGMQAGYEVSVPNYICRVFDTAGNVMVGRVGNGGPCYVETSPGALGSFTVFDVATFDPSGADDSPVWVYPTNGALPAGQLVAGAAHGNPVSVCRADNGTGSDLPGQLDPMGCSVMWNGAIQTFPNYEVLTLVPLGTGGTSGGGTTKKTGGNTGGGGGGGGGSTGGGGNGKPCGGKVCLM